MKVIVLFMVVALVMAVRSARRGRALPFWTLLALTFAVGVAFLSQRAY